MQRHLITSALPYINGIKHLGNLAGSLLPADVYARFLRREGAEVLFVCATDEHGTPAEISAREAGMDVADYCLWMHQRQAGVYHRFGLSFDWFGRSSSRQNRELTQHFYRKLDEHGLIEEKQIQQIYSIDDGRFLPDRYVTGTCPRCGYESARGDQCEQCTTVLDPTELHNPRSTLSGSQNLEVRPTRHLFLKLSQLQEELRQWVEAQSDWPHLTTSIAFKWLDEGLHDRCITRDLQWGVPVPRPGFADKVFYVWFDAPVEYIAATREWAEEQPALRDWQSWWRNAGEVRYTQFLAKDNVPFHTVFWPAMVMGTGESWQQASQIKSFNWLNYYGGKFSTSAHRGVFLDDALESAPADCWRYYLLAQSPESDDASFTWEHFATVVNKDLAGNFGNFVNRVLKLATSRFGDAVPEGAPLTAAEQALRLDAERCVNAWRESLHKLEYRKAIAALRELWSIGNVYLDRQAPWRLAAEEPEAAKRVMRTAIHLIWLNAAAAWPVIPFAAEQVFQALGLTEAEQALPPNQLLDFSRLVAGRKFSVPDVLFQRIEPSAVERWKQQFGGAE